MVKMEDVAILVIGLGVLGVDKKGNSQLSLIMRPRYVPLENPAIMRLDRCLLALTLPKSSGGNKNHET